MISIKVVPIEDEQRPCACCEDVFKTNGDIVENKVIILYGIMDYQELVFCIKCANGFSEGIKLAQVRSQLLLPEVE